jgi:hypothetical protein
MWEKQIPIHAVVSCVGTKEGGQGLVGTDKAEGESRVELRAGQNGLPKRKE